MQVIFQKHAARFRERARAIVGQHRQKIGAAADYMVGGRRVCFVLDARPHTRGGRAHNGGIRQFVADFIQKIVHFRAGVRGGGSAHDFLQYASNSFSTRSRARLSVTVTAPTEVPKISAISGFSLSSKNRNAKACAAMGLRRATVCRSHARISLECAARSGVAAESRSTGSRSSSGTARARCRERNKSNAAFTAARRRYPGKCAISGDTAPDSSSRRAKRRKTVCKTSSASSAFPVTRNAARKTIA